MHSTQEANEPAPKVYVMLAMAAGMWGLLYLGAATVWPRDRSDLTVEGRHAPQLASLTDHPKVRLPTRTKVKAKRNRRIGPSFANRVFRSSTSLN
jgi:hypothetical protein